MKDRKVRLEHAFAQSSPGVDVRNLDLILKAGCASGLLMKRAEGEKKLRIAL